MGERGLVLYRRLFIFEKNMFWLLAVGAGGCVVIGESQEWKLTHWNMFFLGDVRVLFFLRHYGRNKQHCSQQFRDGLEEVIFPFNSVSYHLWTPKP